MRCGETGGYRGVTFSRLVSLGCGLGLILQILCLGRDFETAVRVLGGCIVQVISCSPLSPPQNCYDVNTKKLPKDSRNSGMPLGVSRTTFVAGMVTRHLAGNIVNPGYMTCFRRTIEFQPNR